MHSPALSAAEAGRSPAGARPAENAARLVLVADRGHTSGPTPAGHALAADSAAPAGPVPAQHALAAGGRSEAELGRRRRWPYRALAAALACHFAILALLIVRPDALWPVAPTPPERLGTEDGIPDNVEVSVISAEQLDRLSSDSIRREARPAPEPNGATPPEPPPAPPPQPAQEESDPYFTPAPSTAAKTEAFDPSSFAEMASQQFSAEINYAARMVQAKREQPREQRREAKRSEVRAGNVTAMRPGASHKGKSDEFAKEVVWALAATKPMGNGKYGTAIVTFTVSQSGRVEGLRLLKSAGDKWLDTAVMMSVRQAHMPKPPEPLPSGDRTFIVEYISLEGRR